MNKKDSVKARAAKWVEAKEKAVEATKKYKKGRSAKYSKAVRNSSLYRTLGFGGSGNGNKLK